MTYKFENLGVEITNPTVSVRSVNDFIEGKECNVIVNLKTDSSNLRVQFDGFTYTTTWEDADIKSWVDTKLQEFKTV